MLNVSEMKFVLFSPKGNLRDSLSCKLLFNGLEIKGGENF